MADPLQTIVEHYLGSSDFNGLPFDSSSELVESIPALAELVRSRLLEVVSEADFPNPHIRPWPSRRTVDEQLADLGAAAHGTRRVCLYPTAAALSELLPPDLHRDEPYRRQVAEGGGQLELVYFSFDVLEQYRNDPRYRFEYWDFGVNLGAGDSAYQSPGDSERDEIPSIRVGFAYNVGSLSEGPVIRRACAFLRDLRSLTPEHQRRWETYEEYAQELHPHPVWHAAMMGDWPDGIGPFEKVIGELRAVNELFASAFGKDLLTSTDRPREFGWIVRPSASEWEQFVLTMDKLLSDNLRVSALDAAEATRESTTGKALGTMQRLEHVLVMKAGVAPGEAADLLRPWREVRRARQDPAHALRENVTDETLVRRQAQLLAEVGRSLVEIRTALTALPENAHWTPRSQLSRRVYQF